jgi:hemophore-related protein
MTSGDATRITRICAGSLIGGIALAGLVAPVASAAPDCSPVAVENTTDAIGQQAQDYLNANPEGNKALMTAALQPRPQAEATLRAYANSNPQQYADFKAILAPLGTLQSQCGVQVVPAQFQWAFDQFING